MADDKPIIIVKKGGGHGGHHGGAWKVAYADFVTAMMAFFMVMWLVNSASNPTKEAIASYFRKPGLFTEGSGTPLQIGGAGILSEAAPPKPEEKKKGSGLSQVRLKKKTGSEDDDGQKHISIKGGTGRATGLVEGSASSHGFNIEEPEIESKDSDTVSPEDKKTLQELAEQIRQEIAASPELKELIGIVDVKVEADGLNIEIMDTDKTSMFSIGSAQIQPEAAKAFEKLGGIIAKLPNSIDIVGHTDGKPFPPTNGGYSNWELSSDRANAARRLLLNEGIDATRITSVVGRADKELKNSGDPFAASNRRITLKMRFNRNLNIDIAKDPDSINHFNDYQKNFEKSWEERRKEALKPKTELKEKVHTLTPKEIVERMPKRQKKRIKLPDGSSVVEEAETPDFIGKSKIFGESPVIGRPGGFSN